MAATTLTGSVGNTTFSFPVSTVIQQQYAQMIIGSINGSTELVTGYGGVVTSSTVVDVGPNSVISGNASVSSVQLLLAGQSGSYLTSGTGVSTVVAADNSNSKVINSNAGGTLVAVTGAGKATLQGSAGDNQFTTGVNGQDQVTLGGLTNSLASNGADTVTVGGPSTIMASAYGSDNISLTSGTTLQFINNSAASVLDSITGASGATVSVSGAGQTSVTSGTGPETFYVDTSAGNVTLNGGNQTTDTFEFARNATNASAQDVVSNFATGDKVLIHNYSSYGVAASPGNPAGSVLVLSDGSQITFTNLSPAALSQTVKVF